MTNETPQAAQPLTIELPRNILRAMTLFASDNDIRFYLNGVCVQIGAANDGVVEARLVATNGHMLGLYRVEAPQVTNYSGPVEVIIPGEHIKKIAKSPYNLITLEIGSHKDDRMARDCRLIDAGTSVSFTSIDGKFPDHTRVIPQSCDGKLAQFNLSYLAAFHAFHVAIVGKKKHPLVHVAHNGDASALVRVGCDLNFVGVVMPMRAGEVDMAAPDWSKTLLTAGA